MTASRFVTSTTATCAQRFSGVIAQDVEKVRPDAVSLRGDYKIVNYDALGVKLEPVLER